tara:strand:- start:8978 stop:10348 length:1371 start_codon:yes stop_codon:yes gene_type:complete
MASTYDNDLRLNEMATGDQSGTWGDTTNLNLRLIAEAFSYQADATFTTDANKQVTIANGASDKYRGMYIKVTSTVNGGLTASRDLEVLPRTVSKVLFVENSTTGGQSIVVKQGSGASVTVPNGSCKLLFLDGAGTGAAVYDGLNNLALSGDLTIEGDDLKMGTNTSGHVLVADGTNFNPVAMSGDATMAGNGALTIANDAVEQAMIADDAVGADQLASDAVVNASVDANAAIAFSKMANLTINRALVSDGSGDVTPATTTSTEIGYVNGVTSAIQTQLNTKLGNATNTWFSSADGVNRFYFGNNGSTLIKTATDHQFRNASDVTVVEFTSTGVGRFDNDVVAFYSSDENLKDNIKELQSPLEKLSRIRGVTFDWNDNQDTYEGSDIGVIAQEVQRQFPELTTIRSDGYMAVKYEKLTAVLIAAVNELAAEVKENRDVIEFVKNILAEEAAKGITSE